MTDEEAIRLDYLLRLVLKNSVLKSKIEPYVSEGDEDGAPLEFDEDSLLRDTKNFSVLAAVLELLAEPRPQGLQIEEKLGSGAFGRVYRAVDEDGFEYALKVFTEKGMQSLEREVQLMQFANFVDPNTFESENKHVVGFFGQFFDNVGNPFLLSELVSGPTLYEMKTKTDKKEFFGYLPTIMNDVLDGLAFLHAKGIAHRDVKPENIVFDLQEKKAVLIDLGLACILEKKAEIEDFECDDNLAGTILYFSPSMAKMYFQKIITGSSTSNGRETEKMKLQILDGDLWAAGLTLIECVYPAVTNIPGASARKTPKDMRTLRLQFLRRLADQPRIWDDKKIDEVEAKIEARVESVGLDDAKELVRLYNKLISAVFEIELDAAQTRAFMF